MVATRSTGFSKNVASFIAIVQFCRGYGGKYNPASERLKLNALETLCIAAKDSLRIYEEAKNRVQITTDIRENAFAMLKQLAIRIQNTIAISSIAPGRMDDVRTITRKIYGRRAKALPKEVISQDATGKVTPVHHSVSQQGFDFLLGNFEKLIVLIQSEPLYQSNEADLQLTSLQAHLTELQEMNKAVVMAQADATNALISRNAFFFEDEQGLHWAFRGIKQYVAAAFGPSSKESKSMRAFRFKKIY